MTSERQERSSPPGPAWGERVARHFPDGVDLGDLREPRGRAFAIATLLEHGDRADLAWLAARVERAELERWLARHGARRLSRRSRAFWSTVLAPDASGASIPAHPIAEALWPLA